MLKYNTKRTDVVIITEEMSMLNINTPTGFAEYEAENKLKCDFLEHLHGKLLDEGQRAFVEVLASQLRRVDRICRGKDAHGL